jgi:hypothetical protein
MKGSGKAKRRRERAMALVRAERRRAREVRKAAKSAGRVSEPRAKAETVKELRVVPVESFFPPDDEPLTARERRLAGMVGDTGRGGYVKRVKEE